MISAQIFSCILLVFSIMGVSFFGRDLSVVPLCENFAHLRSLVFTVISHSRSNCVGVKCLSLCSAHFTPRKVISYKELAQFTFFRFTKFISHISFYLFDVNCALLTVSVYAISASLSLLVWGISLLRERQWGSAPLTPATL